jgi:hypothetical protein
MSEVFINCPSCKTLLLSDAVQCPSCNHVIDARRAAELGVGGGSSELPQHTEQVPCRKCGEMNLVGLVRCWSCGTFLRAEIERLYDKMLRSRERIEFTPLPEISSSDMSGSRTMTVPPAAPPPEPPPVDEAGGFELDESAAGFIEDDVPPALPPPKETSAPTGGSAAPPAAGGDGRDEARREQREDEAGTGAGPHAEETGGDALLEIALQEEKQAARAKAARKQKLAMRRKGKVARPEDGAKPATKSAAKLSSKTPANGMKRPTATKSATKPAKAADDWLTDVHLHEVVPSKVKLKPGSLQGQFREADVGFSAEQLVVAVLAKPVGFFTLTRSGGGNKDEARKALRERLEKGPLETGSAGEKADAKSEPLPGAAHRVLSKEQVGRIKVVQPVAFLHESMFAGVSVFGEGRIAVLLPTDGGQPGGPTDAKADLKSSAAWFLSFPLSQFRRFSALLDRRYGVKGLGLADGVPLDDRLKPAQCHYSEEQFEALPVEELPFYQADPAVELELRGHRCTSCGLIVSEESRRKEKIGGLNGKGLAKAKCPKCGGKFGTAPLYRVKPKDTESEADTGESAAVKKEKEKAVG